MPGHFVLLRHQEGDDWDYCVIEHVGTSATVKIDAGSPTGHPGVERVALRLVCERSVVA